MGPCIEAVILREDVGGMSVEDDAADDDGISRYAEPEAEGMMEVCRTKNAVSFLYRCNYFESTDACLYGCANSVKEQSMPSEALLKTYRSCEAHLALLFLSASESEDTRVPSEFEQRPAHGYLHWGHYSFSYLCSPPLRDIRAVFWTFCNVRDRCGSREIWMT